MSASNPYQDLVSGYAQLIARGGTIPLGGLPPLERPATVPDAPKALIFSPHPDDECIVGALSLRLRRELKMDVINVAVTLGSRKDRQPARWEELKSACGFIRFGLLQTLESGLEQVNLTTRKDKLQKWSFFVDTVAEILLAQRPEIIFVPHDNDWNSTHIGTHYLVVDALSKIALDLSCFVIETEFWAPMLTPNLMIESSIDDVADLVAAISFHTGEVERNPYHLRLPAWMMDNVRRGGELVRGQGAAAPKFVFATLYRLRKWAGGQMQEVLHEGRVFSCQDDLSELFGF